ncbi:hypothetical protein Poli38472_004196 [Pythium oligandrum]|uniref:ATP-dependent RNA helicase n=1 Tax=Pythium oligandrum TaxID=41045 RepID=A0A8K1CPN0_PYTOL|nr:hypothetical protein Poli38472_004196 [Pythium oligandrum]|eukprot:TMW66431.1 hypothetical protein Poli38472_004196 [Pythium oligandrum]
MATAFEEMGVCAELLRVIEEQDWLVPTPIQTEAISLLLGGGDVLAAAETRIVRFAKNGSMYDGAFHLGPTTKATAYFPAVCLKNADVELHCEPSSFPYPMEFVDLMHANRDLLVPSSSSKGPNGLPGMPGNSSVVVRPRGIILEPARDLAQQVFDCARVFNKYLTSPKVRVSLCVGGISLKDQLQKLERTGGCDLIIATPGRLMEMLERGFLDLASTSFFVLDEVDQLISTDNVPAILKIHETLARHAPKTGLQRLQASFFSATLHADGVMELADKICHHPQLVDLQGKAVVPATVHHVMLSVDPRQDISSVPKTVPSPSTDAVHGTTTREKVTQYIQNARQDWPLGADKDTKSQILKFLKPNQLVQVLDALAIEQCMVFCRTNLDCDLLEGYLLQLGGPDKRQVFTGDKLERGREHPYSCCVLAGLRSMTSRQKALEAFKDGDVRILICTDVAGRGIDVPRLACVINPT